MCCPCVVQGCYTGKFRIAFVQDTAFAPEVLQMLHWGTKVDQVHQDPSRIDRLDDQPPLNRS